MKTSEVNNLEEQYRFLVDQLKQIATNQILLKKTLSNFKSEFKTRWTKACRIFEKCLKNDKTWLDTSVSLPFCASSVSYNKRGRLSLPFQLCSNRTKRLKANCLRDSSSSPFLTFAACMSQRA